MATTATGTYLDRILENTRLELEQRRAAVSVETLIEAAKRMPDAVPFAAALRRTGVSVIAEFKRASPSKGLIAGDATPTEVVSQYLDGGAAAISVLTDERFFQGSLTDLEEVSLLATPRGVPVLRKDFVIDEYQIIESRAAGASAVLLIVAGLDDDALRSLLAATRSLGMEALVEVHDERELNRAVVAGASVIGINNRDLRTFTVDLNVTEQLAPLAPSNATVVGESGVATADDVRRLKRAGAHAVLVGETLMRASDRAAAVRELLS